MSAKTRGITDTSGQLATIADLEVIVDMCASLIAALEQRTERLEGAINAANVRPQLPDSPSGDPDILEFPASNAPLRITPAQMGEL